MTIEDAIPCLLVDIQDHASADSFRRAILTVAQQVEAAPECVTRQTRRALAAGIILGHARANRDIWESVTETYWRHHCQPPAPEWVEVEPDAINGYVLARFSTNAAGAGVCVKLMALPGDARPDAHVRIRCHYGPEGHRLIIERKRGDA